MGVGKHEAVEGYLMLVRHYRKMTGDGETGRHKGLGAHTVEP